MGKKQVRGKNPKKALTQKEARAFQMRWAMVNAAERAELLATPLDRKLQQLAALMVAVQPVGWTDALKAEDAEVRARWNRLRAALNG